MNNERAAASRSNELDEVSKFLIAIVFVYTNSRLNRHWQFTDRLNRFKRFSLRALALTSNKPQNYQIALGH